MIKRKVVFRKKRQNRLGMFLVTIVVLMLLVVVSINSVGLRQKKESYLEREQALQEQIDAEEERSEQIEEYRKYTQTKKYVEEVAKEKRVWLTRARLFTSLRNRKESECVMLRFLFCAIHPASGCRVCTRSRLPENVPCAECRRKMEKSMDE